MARSSLRRRAGSAIHPRGSGRRARPDAAITSVSAVIFLVSARYNLATSFIVGRVENGEFGIAIAYSAVLIVTMLAAILGLQSVIGRRRLRRADRIEAH